ncbi:uncharacterized protein LOC131997617 [Stomoxys calcitrans]|uniref:uncharacterized protein LOC131997617 n=2 Tax=Stomoxys calcitrans TaxID=35570 RepID=UPI0027E31FA2|nr:uncharacterized protein LOC131997617 [Stomoxys calcitrans]
MPNTPVASTSQQTKRKIGETSPENNNMAKKPVGSMEVSELMEIMKFTMNNILEEKIKNLPTKQDMEDVKAGISFATSEIANLKTENIQLKQEVELLKNKLEESDRNVAWLEHQIQNTKLVFKNISKDKPALNIVKQICNDMLNINPPIASARTLYERNGLQTVIAEFPNENAVVEVLKNTKALAGSAISIERDLNPRRQRNKIAMLLIRKSILEESRKHKIVVRDDKLNINNKWFYWNSERKLMCGREEGESEFEIIILIETHITAQKRSQTEKYFPEYEIYWVDAIKINRFGRAIGGVFVGVKKSLNKAGIKHTFILNQTLCGLQIITENFQLLIVPLYIRGSDWIREFALAKLFMEEMKCENLIVLGDINVRIGESQQGIVDLYRDSFHACTGPRKSKDKELNTNGRRYIDYCNEHNLVILNGQTLGDEDGNFTYLSNTGTSVNDICSVSINMLQYVESFKVVDKIWSDHLPITLNLKLNNTVVPQNRLNLLPKLHWKDSHKLQYQENLTANLSLQLMSNNITCLKHMTNTIVASAVQQNKAQQYVPQKKWFNDRCYWARRKTFEILSKFRKSSSETDRQAYLSAKKRYKDICEVSKRMYYANISEKLNNTSNAKEWWSLVRELNGQDFRISHTLSAEILRTHFMELLRQEQSSLRVHYAPALIVNDILDKDITLEEIKYTLAKTKPNKAPGEDRIPYEFYSNATDEFLTQLAAIFNKIYTEGKIEEEFQKTVIFPIHKKGRLDDASNYRGISFMNSVAKIFMGVLNDRLGQWVEENNILVEFQAGFRKNYSTVDNIYNLASMVNIKLAEKKKVYAFFVDFRAAFDKISRNLLFYKLNQIGISFKFIKMIEAVYQNTQSAVWTGEELSGYFDTESGVKQGCLLSPLLFSLYINDLSDALEGGVDIEGINIKTLLYADDIVILAEDSTTLQQMIANLEEFCKKWSLIVNTEKSKIMVFRNGGRLSQQDKWFFHAEPLEVVSEYKYLGVVLTPKMKFLKHIQSRTTQAKSAIKATWKNFLKKDEISLQDKWNLYMAVCRSVQSYAAQVWGYEYFEEVDQLQRFFLKTVLNLPDSTPNYALYMETDLQESHLYTLGLHLKYISSTLYRYKRDRLPHKLTLIMVQKQIFWVKALNDILNELDMQPLVGNITQGEWNSMTNSIIDSLSQANKQRLLQKALQSRSRFYKNLDFTRGCLYLNGEYKVKDITWIFKARVDLIYLNANQRGLNLVDNDLCTLCNLRERESIYHFLAVCPILRSQRMLFFHRPTLTEPELISILDGREVADWDNLIKYTKNALQYRKLILTEYA